MTCLDIDDIKGFMPHREPMLLIEKSFIDDAGYAHSEYRIKEDEFFTRGHFPGNPVVPGVIQCEIMAQSCAVLVKDEIPGHITLYAGLNNVKFKNMVKPGVLRANSCAAFVRSLSGASSPNWSLISPRITALK